MPQTDLTKMKVADLKRELKQRGLATTGNKTDLQDRLQTALIDGELSLEDPNISGEELDEDGVLTDEEEEAKILDENELLKSPSIVASELALSVGASLKDIDLLPSANLPTPPKKIVLKRQASLTTVATGLSIKENGEPQTANTNKSERKLITINNNDGDDDKVTNANSNSSTIKVSNLTLQERLEMRAKKFGVNSNAKGADKLPTTELGSANNVVVDEKQLETLKRRAERFGCVVSSKMVKLNEEEKLIKRQQRFGAAAAGSAAISDDWAEKKRLRLERFNNTTNATTESATTTGN